MYIPKVNTTEDSYLKILLAYWYLSVLYRLNSVKISFLQRRLRHGLKEVKRLSNRRLF